MERMRGKPEFGLRARSLLLSVLTVGVLLSALAYGSAPDNPVFSFDMINPLELLMALLFALSFGLGLPLVVSGIVVALVLFLFLYLFYRIFLRVV